MQPATTSNAERKLLLLAARMQGGTPTPDAPLPMQPLPPQVAQPRPAHLPVIDMTGEIHVEEGIQQHSNSNSVQAQQDAWHAQHSSPTQSETSQNSAVSEDRAGWPSGNSAGAHGKFYAQQEEIFRSNKRRLSADEDAKDRDRDSHLGGEEHSLNGTRTFDWSHVRDEIVTCSSSDFGTDALLDGHSNGSVGRQIRPRTIQSYFNPGTGEPMAMGSPAQVTMTSPPPPAASTRSGVSRPPAPTYTDGWSSDRSTSSAPKRKGGVQPASPAPQPLSNDVRALQEQVMELQRTASMYEHQVRGLQSELDEAHQQIAMANEKNATYMSKLEEVLRRIAAQEARERREKVAADSVRLGKLVVKWTGPTTMNEAWEDGYATKDLKRRSGELLLRKEELDRRKKAAQAKKRQASRKGAAEDDFELIEELYSIAVHMDQLKRDEQLLAEERRTLEGAKAVHYKECKRIQHEEKSRLNRLPLLNNRYLLQALQGKGGFSEVWRAYDLLALRDVAVKVHQLNPAWSEEKKQNYTKHVTREYAIHKDLAHPRVVQLYDVFEIDVNSFATVLEFCRGTDLDEHLKKHKRLPERDARAILMQIMSGLRYLNIPVMENGERRQGVIHFDLKPGNILFDEMGDVKITDFGLSKIMDDTADGTSMELTSQGAGTYWYLPPECFQVSPRISSKVDVWSVGVIFYQILYGRRPFGEGKTQDRILSEQVMLRATQVEFPAEPKVTKEAQDFIRASLTYDQRMRPDVLQLCQHPYLRYEHQARHQRKR